MKTKIIILLFTFFFPLGTFANDGEFFSEGSTIFPIKETVIELRKEILSLSRAETAGYARWVNVDIYFEFYNPEETKTITVGFVTPPWDDFQYHAGVHPDIKDFTVMVNSAPLEYKIEYLEHSTYSLNGKQDDREYFVYYFDAEFKKGLNIIQHSYSFRGGGSNVYGHDFQYQITTGKGWANSEITSFELNIDLGKGMHFFPETFWKDGKKIDWKIIGTGNVFPMTERLYDYGEDLRGPLVRLINVQSGYISFTAEHFKPDNDIIIGDYNPGKEMIYWSDSSNTDYGWDIYSTYISLMSSDYEKKNFEKLSKEDLVLLKNLMYARKGYVFEDEKLQEMFDSFKWYIPNSSLREDDMLFTKEEQMVLDRLKEIGEKK